MKKFTRIIAIFLCLAMSLTLIVACTENPSNKDDGENNKADNDDNGGNNNDNGGDNGTDDEKKPELFDYYNEDLSSYIKLGTYKGNTVEIEKAEIDKIKSDTEVAEKIKAMRLEKNIFTKVTDRAAMQGDTVVVDYTGYMDGEKFSGGEAKNATVDIVENSGYIDGFAEGIVGHTPGEEFSVKVKFPDDYGHVAYQGKEAEFVFNFHYIAEFEINDEFLDFVTEYSKGECTSAEEFSSYLAEAKYEKLAFDVLWNKIKDSFVILSYPQASVDFYLYEIKSYYENFAAQLGMTYENLLIYAGIKEENLLEYAHNRTREDLIIYQISKLENRLPTDADIDSYAAYYAEYNLASLRSEMLADGYSQGSINQQSAADYAKEHHMNSMIIQYLRTDFSEFLVYNNTFVEK